jgi:hypothetical protein
VTKKQLLKQLKEVQRVFIAAPLNWLYNNDGIEYNCAQRAAFYVEQSAKLAVLLPDIIRELDK